MTKIQWTDREDTMNKRRPERKRPTDEVKIKFSTTAKLRNFGMKLEEASIWFRVSGRWLVVKEEDKEKLKKLDLSIYGKNGALNIVTFHGGDKQKQQFYENLERNQPAHEVQIKFANRVNLFEAQQVLREAGIHFRPYGVSMFVKEACEEQANQVIERENILLSEGI